jgi:hypothetical protein
MVVAEGFFTMSRLRLGLVRSVLTFVLLLIPVHARAADEPAKVYVVLWFDTEDYILPASDDAALRLATFLKSEGIRGTFKIVGEKARTLEQRGRRDVIEALAQHEIGYHSNYHSTQPSPAMYLNELGWDEGVREFDRREKPGFEDVKRIFGQTPSCYGQPGSSWGPQSFGAMQQWGMGIYLDAGGHINLDNKPLYYCNTFTMYKLAHLQRTALTGMQEVEQAETKFLASRSALQKEGGGLVSTIYHPCEFVHKEFWDGVNFRAGANPPQADWRLPRQKSAEETDLAFACFERYVRFMKRFGDVRFITASEALKLYRDQAREQVFQSEELKAIARGVQSKVVYIKVGASYVSAAEAFWLLDHFVVGQADAMKTLGLSLPVKGAPFGPSGPPVRIETPIETSANQFLRTARDVRGYMAKQGTIPSAIWLGSQKVGPEEFLQGLAEAALAALDGKPIPEKVVLRPATLEAAKYVSDDDPKLWGWVIFPRGFHAPALMQLAKRQAWTIKPAVLHPRD